MELQCRNYDLSNIVSCRKISSHQVHLETFCTKTFSLIFQKLWTFVPSMEERAIGTHHFSGKCCKIYFPSNQSKKLVIWSTSRFSLTYYLVDKSSINHDLVDIDLLSIKWSGSQAHQAFTVTVAEQSIANLIVTLSCSVEQFWMTVESDYFALRLA